MESNIYFAASDWLFRITNEMSRSNKEILAQHRGTKQGRSEESGSTVGAMGDTASPRNIVFKANFPFFPFS